MKATQFNKRWHSPINVYGHIRKLTENIGSAAIEKKPQYKRVREARIAAIMAFVLTRIRNLPTVLRLPLHDPPDAYLMQPNSGTMDIITVEITSYRNSKESLLEQLDRTKFNYSYSQEYILLIELFTEDKVNYEEIYKYRIDHNIPFAIWSLKKIQDSPDTIAKVVVINPMIMEFTVNIGQEAYYFNEKYKIPQVIFSKKAYKPEDIKTIPDIEKCNIAPWEELED
jgi:hypothetical protein